MLLLDRTLLKMTKGLWGWILLITAVRFAVLAGITQFAEVLAGFLGNSFDPSITVQTLTDAVRSAFTASALILAGQLVQGELEYRTIAKARRNMRASIFQKVLELDAGNIETIGPVSAITSSLDAVERMQVYYSSYLPSLLYSLIAPVYLFLHLKSISLPIAVFLLVISVGMLPIHNAFRYKFEHMRTMYWSRLEDMTSYYLDSIRGLSTLKLFDQDRNHAQVLGVKAEALTQAINGFMKINFVSFLTTEGIMNLSIIICLAAAVMMLKNGRINLSSALTILMLSYSYFASVRTLMNASHDALTAVSAAAKVEMIMNTDTARPYDPAIPVRTDAFSGIQLEGVRFHYEGRKDVLRNIDLKIEKGKTTAFVGLSGCGKSTLASLLMRFIDAQEGHIYLEGNDYFSLTPEQVRRSVVLVPQSVSIFSGTIRDNLRLARPSATDEEMMSALQSVRLSAFVQSLKDGLDAEVGDAGAKLSGGQRQKIGIARALLTNCEYMIFDEATSSVDPQSEQEIRAAINALSADRTLIIISHRLSAIRNADQICVLNQGIVEETGTHEELMKRNGLYSRLVKEQAVLEEVGG